MEKNRIGIVGFFVVLSLFSCEAVFTTNMFEWAQRDPSNMSTTGKVAYARDALAAADREAMKKAYDAMKDTTNPELKPLVAELALGAAGVTNALANLLGEVAAGGSEETIETAMENALTSFKDADLTLIVAASELILAAEAAGAPITGDQYFIAGVGLLIVALNQAGGSAGNIDTSTGPGATAKAFLTSSRDLMPPESEAASLLNDFSDYF